MPEYPINFSSLMIADYLYRGNVKRGVNLDV